MCGTSEVFCPDVCFSSKKKQRATPCIDNMATSWSVAWPRKSTVMF